MRIENIDNDASTSMVLTAAVMRRARLKDCDKKDKLLALYGDYYSCTKCAARHSTVPTFSSGDPASRVAIIGLNPGAEEDAKGIPFIGPAGQWFRRAFTRAADYLEEPRIHPDNLFVTNMARCQFRNEKGWNRLPFVAEYNNCNELLKKEIEIVDPDLIIMFGKDTVGMLANDMSFQTMGRIHGQVFDTTYFHRPIRVIAMYHPSYLVRLGGSGEGYEEAANKMWSAVQEVNGILNPGGEVGR